MAARSRASSSWAEQASAPCLPFAALTAATAAFTARSVRPRTVARQAASISGVARPTTSRATDPLTSPSSTAPRRRVSSPRARETRARGAAAKLRARMVDSSGTGG